ncbi:phage holin family protein [bacterium]|jgi:putative membrane protein|nr:phage holin family protein [bacterium]MBT6293865.1 phage holin family protein [bacterium]
MIQKILISIALNSIVLKLTTIILPNTVNVNGGVATFIYFGIAFGILNTILKPILNIITLPLRFLTLGASVILVNTVILYATNIGLEILFKNQYSLSIEGTSNYLLAGLIIGTINWIKNLIK